MKSKIQIIERYSVYVLRIILFIYLFFPAKWSGNIVEGAASGDYRSAASGSWSSTSTWQRFNGTTWTAATATPSNTDGEITILNGHTVTVSSSVNVDQVIIFAGGQVVHNNGTFKVVDGTGADLTNYGTITISSQFTIDNNATVSTFGLMIKNSGGYSINSGAQMIIDNGGLFRKYSGAMTITSGYWTVKSGGTFEDADNGTNLPQADWQDGSTLLVTGALNYLPGNLNQNFYNVTWNCPNETNQRNMGLSSAVVRGDLTIISTGTGSIFINSGANNSLSVGGNYLQQGGIFAITENGDWTLYVGGNFTMTGGTFRMTDATSATASGNPVLNISGNLSVSNATFDMSQYTGLSTSFGRGTVNLTGDLTVNTGSIITETSPTVGAGTINFNKSGIQQFIKSGNILNSIDYNIQNGSTVNAGTNIFTGLGNFVLNSGGGIQMGSALGISSSGASGNVQVTGTRIFSTTGNYTYNGTLAQITGAGLPSVVNNLTVNNSLGLTITSNISVNGTLTMTSGNIITGVSSNLTIGTSALARGNLVRTSGTVIGYLIRWYNNTIWTNMLYPVGTTNYEGATVSFTSAPSSGGTIAMRFVEILPGTLGLPVNDNGTNIINIGTIGYWEAVAGNGLTGGTYTLDLVMGGFTGIIDYSGLRILRRNDIISPWTASGTHSAGTGSNANPIAHRSGLTSYGQFGIGGGAVNPLPVELTDFKVYSEKNSIYLKWKTASEFNNNFFTVEKSGDGNNFSEVGKIMGNGTSSNGHNYLFRDENPLAGRTYYRLSQTDFNGIRSVLGIREIQLKKSIANEEILAHPTAAVNSFNNELNISIEANKNCSLKIQIFNANGKIILNQQYKATSGANHINIPEFGNFQQGIYIINISAEGDRKILRTLKL